MKMKNCFVIVRTRFSEGDRTIRIKAALIFIITFIWLSSLSAQESKSNDKHQKGPQENTEELNNKLCPVDFKRLYGLEHKASYAYEGKLYYFDSDECVEKFKEDPQGYLKEWQKKESFRRINIIND